MKYKFLLTLCLVIFFTSCNAHAKSSKYSQAEPISIIRFDKELFELINTGDSALQKDLEEKYPDMLELTGKGILNMRDLQVPGFYNKLIGYYSEPTLKALYKDAITKYEDIENIQQELGNGFAYLSDKFSNFRIPTVYMHVSGLNQNILTSEKTLSLSIDKYMGYDYPLYQDFFYDYQRIKMQLDYIVPDYLAGWLMSEFPFSGKENILLDRMIYEGKIKYLISQALPEKEVASLMGYTEENYNWIKENEGIIWKAIIERKHLYTPDHVTTGQYFEEIPSRFLSDDAPGNLGTYIGWQIVNHYMKESNATSEALMQNNNAQDILTNARYNPK